MVRLNAGLRISAVSMLAAGLLATSGCGPAESASASTPAVASATPAPRSMAAAPAPARGGAAIAAIARALEGDGLAVRDRTATLPPSRKAALYKGMQNVAAARVAFLELGADGAGLLLLEFDRAAPLEQFLDANADLVVDGRVVVLPVDIGPNVWTDAVQALRRKGGVHREHSGAVERAMRESLEATTEVVRSAVEQYTASHDAPPDFEIDPWRDLLDGGLAEAPANPFSPPDVSRHVAILTVPGATGVAVDPAEAGWAWNVADHTFHAAGVD